MDMRVIIVSCRIHTESRDAWRQIVAVRPKSVMGTTCVCFLRSCCAMHWTVQLCMQLLASCMICINCSAHASIGARWCFTHAPVRYLKMAVFQICDYATPHARSPCTTPHTCPPSAHTQKPFGTSQNALRGAAPAGPSNGTQKQWKLLEKFPKSESACWHTNWPHRQT